MWTWVRHIWHTFNTCLFGGQWIATHNAIKDIMYALVRESEHVVWREQWCTFTLGVSLRINVYMIREDQVFVVNVMVTDLTHETMATSVISRPTSAAAKLSAIIKICKYRRLHERHHFILVAMDAWCTWA
jgi:hypothetical protein